MTFRRIVVRFLLATCFWNQLSMLTVSGLAQSNNITTMGGTTGSTLEATRALEVGFLRELHDALRMDDKAFGVHNWFRQVNESCHFTGITCDTNGLVAIVDLTNMGLSGSLPLSFSPLSRLERLALRNNDIQGNLPNHFPDTLRQINFDQNRMHGTLPTFQFTSGSPLAATPSQTMQFNLERLIISENLLEGTLPTTLCQLTKLKAINLSRNPDLYGKLPTCLAKLPNLTGLLLKGTRLIATSPSQSDSPSASPKDTPSKNPSLQPTPTPSSTPSVLTMTLPPTGVIVKPPSQSDSPTLNPTAAPSRTPVVTIPSSIPGVVPTTLPPQENRTTTIVPTVAPVTTSTPVFPMSRAPRPFRSNHHMRFRFRPKSNDQTPSSNPTSIPSADPTNDNLLEQPTIPDRQPESTSFYDGPAFLPVFVLVCIGSATACLLTLNAQLNQSPWKRHFERCGSWSSSDRNIHNNNTTSVEEEDDLDEEVVFSKEGHGENAKKYMILGVMAPPQWESTYNFANFDKALSPPDSVGSAPQTVTTRPCIVQPQTLAAQPKVRFLLSAKSFSSSASSSCEDQSQPPLRTNDQGTAEDNDKNDDTPIVESPPRLTAWSVLGTFLCTSPFMPDQARDHETSGLLNDVSWKSKPGGSLSNPAMLPTYGNAGSPELPSVMADSSSVSSTTPVLNPLDCSRSSKLERLRQRDAQQLRPSPNDTLPAAYARKYFPNEARRALSPPPPPPPPPVEEVHCVVDNEVSFSWSNSNEGPFHERLLSRAENSLLATRERFSFRPPRYYNTMVKPTTKLLPSDFDDAEEEEEDYHDLEDSVLGIRSRYSDHPSYDEYEIELPVRPIEERPIKRSFKDLPKKYPGW